MGKIQSNLFRIDTISSESTTNSTDSELIHKICNVVYRMLTNKYLFYFLIASKNDFVRKGEGGAQPNISREKLVSHLIPLPPLKEQHRIVSKIEELASIMSR